MAASRFDRPWHGIPRREIAWYPMIHEENVGIAIVSEKRVG